MNGPFFIGAALVITSWFLSWGVIGEKPLHTNKQSLGFIQNTQMQYLEKLIVGFLNTRSGQKLEPVSELVRPQVLGQADTDKYLGRFVGPCTINKLSMAAHITRPAKEPQVVGVLGGMIENIEKVQCNGTRFFKKSKYNILRNTLK